MATAEQEMQTMMPTGACACTNCAARREARAAYHASVLLQQEKYFHCTDCGAFSGDLDRQAPNHKAHATYWCPACGQVSGKTKPFSPPGRKASGGTLVVLVGLPGSGKSTAAKALAATAGAVVVSPDDVRARMLGVPNDDVHPKPFDEFFEPLVWTLVERAVRDALRVGHDVVLDATSLTRRDRENAVVWALLERARYAFLVHPFDPATCFARRGHQIPREALERMVAAYEPPTPDEGPVAFVAPKGASP